MLEVKNLKKSYGSTKVLKGVDLTIENGQVVVVLGPSGVGKTTLMRCINQLETADSGDIVVDGQNLNTIDNPREWHRKVGMVFQNFNLFPHRTALENITEAPIYAYGQDKNEAIARGKKLLAEVGLADKADSYPGELSGGQCQRVAIARSCALEPSVLCFDEPTSALDEASTEQVSKVIRALAKQGMAIMVITHDLPFAQMVGDQVLKMVDGKIQQ
ncbi:polar amino acid ABC transporter ATP-binding protein [Boudabousia tangfeifanii]|uniref:Polar amino acid ABC transporter ATP-binding protein n=1 Tax=Boudabousia tangfeifanii TaxID=1912795 RepID=A0A1D9MKZ9_9ACTO|nr:amino acid ABC transporter ATP-binding protein [Boudabousia tangfeifanii]AOZ72962.1 polar amino acid ABC transporter ATP-binding protein [Boudabousia tangfeifanii]